MHQEQSYQQQQAQHTQREGELLEAIVIRERAEAIRNIETDVILVKEIFTDLAQLTSYQGAYITHIDAKIVQASADVESGTHQLKQASIKQKTTRKQLCCCFLITFISVLCILGAIILSLKHVL